jgi:septal ring-binding cell division protein DamX
MHFDRFVQVAQIEEVSLLAMEVKRSAGIDEPMGATGMNLAASHRSSNVGESSVCAGVIFLVVLQLVAVGIPMTWLVTVPAVSGNPLVTGSVLLNAAATSTTTPTMASTTSTATATSTFPEGCERCAGD